MESMSASAAVHASIGGSGDNAAIAVTVGGGSCSVGATATGSHATVSVAIGPGLGSSNCSVASAAKAKAASTNKAAAGLAPAKPDAATAEEPIAAGTVESSQRPPLSLPSSWCGGSQDLLLGC